MALVAAATLVAEIGDITRFANPRQLMAYLGLVPSEHSSEGHGAKAVFPRLATVRHDECSSRLPGAIGSRRGLAASSCCGRKVWPNRSAIPRGRHRNDCAGGIASWRGQESHRPWSPPRLRANWQALSGQSPDRRSPSAPDALILAEHEPRRPHRTNIRPKLGKAGGTSRPGEPSFPLPVGFHRRWLLDRGSSATHHRSGGNQPAHQSMINRRFMIVPPALPSGGHAGQLEQTSKEFPCLRLETANLRVDRI